MNLSQIIYLTPYLISLIICSGVCFFSFKRRDHSGAWSFTFLTIFEIIWCLGYILQSLDATLWGKLFWNDIQFIGAIGAPLAYFTFGFEYIDRPLRRPFREILFVFSGLLYLFICTDGLHHLFRSSSHLVAGSPFSTLIYTDGPLFNIYTAFAYLLLVFGTYILVKNFFISSRAYRMQAGMILLGVLFCWIVTLITWLKLVPISLERVTPISFAVSNLIIAWALFHYHLFDLVPIAYVSIVSSVDDGIVILDNHRRIADLNPAALRIFKRKLNQITGKLMDDELPALLPALAVIKEKEVKEVDIDITIDGVLHIFEAHISTICDRLHQVIGKVIILHDVTRQKKAEEELQVMAITDPLTNLFNRRYFFDITEREFERCRRIQHQLSIILMDIDNFKRINDCYGHIIGDQVLQNLTRHCQESLREYDLMARFGGEEFIILLPETDAEQALCVAQRLRCAIESATFTAGCEVSQITISLGVAVYTGESDLTVDKLVDRADHALLAVKQCGKNQVKLWE